MSKCVYCGNELLSGDFHWEMGLCNRCYNRWLNDETSIGIPKNQWKTLYENAEKQIEELKAEKSRLEKELNDFTDGTLIVKLGKLEAENERLKEDKEFLIKSISSCTEPLPNGVAFDIATDDMRYQIVSNLCDQNREHTKQKRELRQQLKEKDEEIEKITKEKEVLVNLGVISSLKDEVDIAKIVEELKQSQNQKAKEVLKMARAGIVSIKVIKQKDIKLEIAAGDMRYECLKIIDQLEKELENEMPTK